MGDFNDPIPALLELTDAYGNRVDLLAGIRGLNKPRLHGPLRSALKERQFSKILGREDFIATKVFDGAPGDIMDAQNAIAVADDAQERK